MMQPDCTIDADCAKYNVATAARYTDTGSNNCNSATLGGWQKELCSSVRATSCDNDNAGCEKFKSTLKLKDLPADVTSIRLTGPHFAKVTGDLADLANNARLTTLSLPDSPLITGDIKELETTTGFTALKHVDLAAAELLHGDVKDLGALTYVNLAAARGVSGSLNKLPATLVYGNFRAARYLSGDVGTITKATPPTGTNANGKCKLKELDISGADSGSDDKKNIFGKLLTGAAAWGLFDRCKELKYVDLGNNFGELGATLNVVKGTYDFELVTNQAICIKANGLATPACKP